MEPAAVILKKYMLLRRKAMIYLGSALKKQTNKQEHHLANKGEYSQSYGFSSSHIVDICPVDIFQ